MWQRFENMSSKKVAILIFATVFPILFIFRTPYIVEADVLLYMSKMMHFVTDWDMFVFKSLSAVKHILYFIVLGVFRVFTPFLTPESTMILFSTFFSSLCVSLTYLLSEKIFKNRNIALISAVMLFSTRMFLYFTLLGEQYTFQAFFMLVTFLLIYEDRYSLAGIVLGISLLASPSTGYITFAYTYLIWKRSKNKISVLKIWLIPTMIFAPVLLILGKYYSRNVGWTTHLMWYHIIRGEIITGIKVLSTQMIDNFILFLPFLVYGCYLAYKGHNKTYKEILYLFLLTVLPASPLIITAVTAKWYLPMMPIFVICATIPFVEWPKLKKIFPLLVIVNLVIISSMLLIPLYKESINQYNIFTSGEVPEPIIMRWSTGTFYEYYSGGRTYYEIMAVELTETGSHSLDGMFEEHGIVYLYDYIEVQCRPITSLYGVFKAVAFGDEIFTVMDRINSRYNINYSIYKEFDDGTIIWELAQK